MGETLRRDLSGDLSYTSRLVPKEVYRLVRNAEIVLFRCQYTTNVSRTYIECRISFLPSSNYKTL